MNSTLKWKQSPKTVSPSKSPLIRLLPVRYLDEVTNKQKKNDTEDFTGNRAIAYIHLSKLNVKEFEAME